MTKYLSKIQDAILSLVDSNPDDFDEPQEFKALLSFILIMLTVIIGAIFFKENEGWMEGGIGFLVVWKRFWTFSAFLRQKLMFPLMKLRSFITP